ncbi:hypothetical protein BP6252_07526 [Coleophoma cylindrospora]|uniref:Heterokaryon incompatibility domain-containing protein n=1 Tax=Coleophoma cylindrospora TaxID=1849047 RepID=A0A3D8RA84_9HELO|nr:hypothetical protein BP6252_07526 [Coleophoma cylindrospora]
MAAEHKDREPDLETVMALRDVFGRAWFRRTWIIQEIAASQSAVVVCGPRAIPWVSVRNACIQIERVINAAANKSLYLGSGFQHFHFLNEIIDLGLIDPHLGKYAQSHRDLLYLINSFSHMDATDPRDKVYGLLGLSNENGGVVSEMGRLEPDYAKPVQQIYTKVARHLILSTGRLDVLRACLGTGKVTGLPSWVPDWTVTMMRSTSGMARWREPFSLPHMPPPQGAIAAFSDDLSTITVRGFIIGTLGPLEGSLLRKSQDDEISYQSHKRMLNSLISIGNWMVGVFFLLLRIPGAGKLLRFLARRDPMELGFFLGILADIRPSLSKGFKFAFPETLAAWTKYLDFTVREEAVASSFLVVPSQPMPSVHAQSCSTYAKAREGDVICMFVGGNVPFITRQESERLVLVGPASFGGFVPDGLVWAHAKKGLKNGTLALHSFTLF